MTADPRVLSSAILESALARLTWSDGFEALFAVPWLLDNALSDEAGLGGHRVRTVAELAQAGPVTELSIGDDRLRLIMGEETRVCEITALRAFAEGADSQQTTKQVPWPRGVDMASRPGIPFPRYLADDATLEKALAEVVRFGLVKLTDAGIKSGAVDQAVARFGYIRETNYGRCFEVRTLTAPDHLAYTNRALEPHTDNPYRVPTPTLQLLHCRRSAGEGGATYFIDGLSLTEHLKSERPDAFLCLTRHQVPFAYKAANGEFFEARSPVIRLDSEGNFSGLRFNHRALGRVDLSPQETAQWYEAYLCFAQAANDPARRLAYDLAPGDMVIFDNERLLHGRTEFTRPADRLLEGCYADRDGLLATLARLRTTRNG